MFHIASNLPQETLRLDLAEEWLDDRSPAVIEDLLRRERIVDRLKSEKKVLLTNENMP
jgi:hypothetical protein